MQVSLQISSLLDEVEKSHKITILFASDAGSRAYGWDSEISDFDIHFIYCHPTSYYITIQNKQTVLEIQKEIIVGKQKVECNLLGWDLRHCLTLAQKSNVAIAHAMTSPIVYREFKLFSSKFLDICNTKFCRRTAARSLMNLVKGNFLKSVCGKKKVRVKIYLYLLHHLLYVKYLLKHKEDHKKKFPPLELMTLVKDIDPVPIVRKMINYLMKIKKQSKEKDPCVDRLHLLEIYLIIMYKKIQPALWKMNRILLDAEMLDSLLLQTLESINIWK